MKEQKIVVILGGQPKLSPELVSELTEALKLPVEQVESLEDLSDYAELSNMDTHFIEDYVKRKREDGFAGMVRETTKRYRSKSDRKRNKRDRWI